MRLTKEEVNRLFQDVELHFSHYYKYTFYFEGNKGNIRIKTGWGGNANDIYRCKLAADSKTTFHRVEDWDWVDITEGDETIFIY